MPRRPRFSTGGYVFHALNRAVSRNTIFSTDADFAAFERVMQQGLREVPMRVLCYCLMPTHWHMILWPRGDDDLSEYLRWVSVTHTQRWHAAHGTSGTGPLYQGRFKSFPVETDQHFYTVSRYVERNALRANLVARAENWRWSSLWQWKNDHCDVEMHAWPLDRPVDWLEYVNGVETEAELAALRAAVLRGSPFGSRAWTDRTATQLGLQSTLRARGRPRK